jgi:hypothetical protein
MCARKFLEPRCTFDFDAIGYWQFKKETAKNLNRADAVVDERKHLMASTKANIVAILRNIKICWVTGLPVFCRTAWAIPVLEKPRDGMGKQV